MSLYLRDVVFWDRPTGELRPGNLRIEPGADGAMQLTDAPPAAGATVIDGRGHLALEGLTCGHHHIYSALARGMPAPPRTPKNFAEILELVWWRLDRCLDLDMVRASALAAAMDCLRCGVTRVIDHHASPGAVAGSLGAIADAFDAVGLGHVLCYELSDRDGGEVAAASLAETDAHLASGRPGLVGLHASFTVGDALLRAAVDLARRHGTGLHLHVAEDRVDQDRCLADHGCRVVERLHAAGVLDQPGTILAHCLHLNDHERRLVADSPAWVVQNTESNQNNAVGEFSARDFVADRILVGTDGLHSDMLRSARAAYLTGQAEGLSPAGAWQRLWNNPRYVEAHHRAAARRNDVVLLDYAPPTPLSTENLAAHAMFGLDARQVRLVIAGGRVVLQDGVISSIDQAATLDACREQARRLWRALATASPKGQP
ncbi:MAG: amidohydrolase family protein [Candidatus Krumholzibacteriia bacterium]